MRKIIAITQVSVDGIMQAPGGPVEDPTNGFVHGGWAMPFVDGSVNIVETDSPYDLLLGRRTYDIFAGYWPFQDNAIGRAFGRATKYVATHSTDQLRWGPSVRIGDDVVNEIRQLKETSDVPLHIWGSGRLLQTLIAADLVDEYRLAVFPVVLGQGKRLFEDGVPPRALALVDTQRTATGVLVNAYRPVGPLPNA